MYVQLYHFAKWRACVCKYFSLAFSSVCYQECNFSWASVHLLTCSLFRVFSAVGSTQTSSSGDITVLSDERPTLPELMELNIPQLVGTIYEKFGTLLLNDDTGIQVESIEAEYRGNSEKINTKILQEWLKGRGSSVTWNAIVAVLRKCNLTHLADQILASKHASH